MGHFNIVNYTDNIEEQHAFNYITNLPRKRLPDDIREQVLDYLCNIDFMDDFAVLEGYYQDPFMPSRNLKDSGHGFDDGKYMWRDRFIFYVRDYHLELPESFVTHVTEFFENGGKVNLWFDWRTERLLDEPYE